MQDRLNKAHGVIDMSWEAQPHAKNPKRVAFH